MRYVVKLKLNVFKLDLDYRKLFISLIKNCVESIDKNLYYEYYNAYTMKPYTFSVYFPKSQFSKDGIKLFDKYCYFYFTSSNQKLSKNIMSELIKLEKYSYKSKIKLEVIGIQLDDVQFIKGDTYTFKMMSPLVVRKHILISNKDVYLKTTSSEFTEYLILNIKKQVDSYFFIDIDTTKLNHQVISHFDLQFNAYTGNITISADNWILNKLYQEGIGSRRSQGFGMLGV